MPALLGALAAAFSIALIWPQVWLSVRHRRTSGLSATSCWLGASLNVCWLLYGLLLHDRAQVATNAVVGAANVAILAALLATTPALRTRRALRSTAWSAVALLAVAATAVAAVKVFHAAPAAAGAALGVVISIVGAASAIPQPLSLLRDRAQDLSGLSPARWWLTVASCAAWVSYGAVNHQPAVWGSASIGLLGAITVCAVLTAARARLDATVALLPNGTPVAEAVVAGRQAVALAA